MRNHIPTIVLISGFLLWSGGSSAQDEARDATAGLTPGVGQAEGDVEGPKFGNVDPPKTRKNVPGLNRLPPSLEIIPPADFNPSDRSGTIAPEKRKIERAELSCGTKSEDGSVKLYLTTAEHPTTRKYFRGTANLSFTSVKQEETLIYHEVHHPQTDFSSESWTGVLIARVPAKFFDPDNWKLLGATLWFDIPDLGIEDSTAGDALSIDKACPQKSTTPSSEKPHRRGRSLERIRPGANPPPH